MQRNIACLGDHTHSQGLLLGWGIVTNSVLQVSLWGTQGNMKYWESDQGFQHIYHMLIHWVSLRGTTAKIVESCIITEKGIWMEAFCFVFDSHTSRYLWWWKTFAGCSDDRNILMM